jgi:hypothetical protein
MQIFGLATHGQLRLPRPYCRGNQRRPVDLICASAVDTVPVHSWSGAIMLPTPPHFSARRNKPQAPLLSVAKSPLVLRRS